MFPRDHQCTRSERAKDRRFFATVRSVDGRAATLPNLALAELRRRERHPRSPRVSLVFLLSRSLVAAIAFNNVMAVVGFAQGGLALSGTPAVGWLQAILAFLAFTLVFGKVRRGWAGSSLRRHL